MTFDNFGNLLKKIPLIEGRKHPDTSPKDRIIFNRTVSDWCLRNAARCITRQDMDEALQWNTLAGRVLSFECDVLTSLELEKQLIQIGTWLRTPELKASYCRSRPHKRWLHVLTTAFPFGGHTSMLRKWIELDPRQNNHSVVLLEQTRPVPESLTETVQLSGGEVIRLDPRQSLLSRAVRLREIAWTQADVVVLHTHPWDVIGSVALALPGGPPVLLVNHAAHLFWVGTSVTDMILNCRCSPQEDEWTKEYRGIHEIMHLPIPLSEPNHISKQDSKSREIARKSLQLPKDAVVMLTIGVGNKYTPVPGIDFFQSVGAVLKARKNAYLLAVGPNSDLRLTCLSKEVDGRLLLVERLPHSEMSTYFAAADLYLEGFPFGSTTALLEAGLMGIPCVLPPKECPPPFTSDGIALQHLEQPATMSDHVERIQRLLEDGQERLRLGQLMAGPIKAHHCGAAWTEYLEKVQNNLPAVHGVRMVNTPKGVPEELSAYWTAFSSVVNGDPLTFVCRQSLYPNLKTNLDEYFQKTTLSRTTRYETEKLTFILMNIGDHYYWHNKLNQARHYYKYAIKHNPFRLQIWIKYICLLSGNVGARIRDIVSKLKGHFYLALFNK